MAESRLRCFICGAGGFFLYRGLRDVRFDIEGTFDMRRCPSCGLLWLDPTPEDAVLNKHYAGFFPASDVAFHAGQERHRLFSRSRDALREMILCGYYGYRRLSCGRLGYFIGRWLGVSAFLRMKASWDCGDFLPTAPREKTGLVIDAGCGEGGYLAMLKELGWSVLGIEPDAAAAATAQKRGIRVLHGKFEDVDLEGMTADVIVFRHVLEHVRDPLSALQKSYSLLKKGGRLLIRVPNAGSLSHRVFGRSTYHLDPPRHLYGFSVKSMKRLLKKLPFEHLSVKTLLTTAKTAYDHCVDISESGKTNMKDTSRKRGRRWFWLREWFFCLLGLDYGEEIEVVAVK